MDARRDQLIARRKALGLTQEALARELEVERTTVARWETGATTPGLWAHRPLADALQVPIGAVSALLTNAWTAAPPSREALPDAEERAEARRLLSHAAEVTLDLESGLASSWGEPIDQVSAPAPQRIGPTDVEHVINLTAAMRGIDYAHGGGACRDAVAAQSRWTEQLLTADCSAEVRTQLLVALADLHNLAGWSSFDVGMYSTARRHFARAIEQAREAEDDSLTANVLYRMGRLHLHRGLHREALRFFQLGQVFARSTGCGTTAAMLSANEAWAYAYLDDKPQMARCLLTAHEEFADADTTAAASWVAFFGASDLDAMTGITLTSLPSSTETDMARAMEHLDTCVEARGPAMARSLTFELTALSVAALQVGDHDRALDVGRAALHNASAVRSVRTIDRLEPLQSTATVAGLSDASDLAHDIATLRASA
ncbi:helix-turn-helix domain-containing protein [Nocardioides sp. NPDC057772]|uniref:helix-turn-helix domain-containing protein n=1 Tax=Nocardioides sp. NPDC057772 TaxID=3346245 RepID=UPI00366C1AF3